MDVKIMDDKL